MLLEKNYINFINDEFVQKYEDLNKNKIIFNDEIHLANHINEMTYETMQSILEIIGFKIAKNFGTFASQKDIEPILYETGKSDLTIAYEYLKDYYEKISENGL